MDVKKLEILIKTVEMRSLTLAARQFGLTQSGVSQAIASLERELGFALLVRTRTGARLTDEGERVIPYIRELLRQKELLAQEAERICGASSGEIRIGTFTSVATHWLPPMIKEFQKDCPAVRFKLFNGDYHDVNTWLGDGSIDLGFVTLPNELKCECITLREDRLVAILPKGHPLAANAFCRAEDIAGQPFISLLQASDRDARRVLEKAGVKPDVKFTTKDDYAVIAMVGQGLGVSIVPELLLRGRGEDVEIRPMQPPASRTVALALPAGEKTGPAARRFAQFAERWVEKNP